ncbi:MAG: hypothetical protein A3G32_09570 [Deltaproteobacteria bacterium RIFCSPLOWO2_12_FULL_40_28]|nr:MAG: hypothetical protein A3C45_07840 [Deltaproteobacteria bacterium RIFCSPHIGHO2_02_FULL_40_28]OGQ20529.1 MAG: hypothetical protein A3E27_02630 [Deltaproteobacteria bacterium RIFCSPHIGHO2_12_FULL_40_32]OGQ41180.1 MAG: hypothetical protein A3I69_07865 [Deltaproteobacteria bacterium RIFCSPLOWO2_02_FULL_40_36]OGQ55142.1 MAG: hypothetical protein A3G32_09570 [Deltaproteobacteria bacterium RIFCSPLOWO2_12_FULL_40_28]
MNLTKPKYKPEYPVSAFESFFRDQKEFTLKYLKGVGSSATNWGKLLHEVLQFLDFPNLTNLETVLVQALVNQHILDPNFELKKTLFQTIENLMRNEKIRRLLSQKEQVNVECPFLLDLNSFLVRGQIDRMVKKENEIWIIDFKTENLDPNEILKHAEQYFIQMGCYALAMQKTFLIPLVETHLIFTTTSQVITWNWDHQKLTDIENKLMKAHEIIEGLNFG